MADRATIKVTERREYLVTVDELSVMVGRAFSVDTRGAWLDLVGSEACRGCGEPVTTDALGEAVLLRLPDRARVVAIEAGE